MTKAVIDYDVVANAARQMFQEKVRYYHPFFRPHVERVFDLYTKTHETLKSSANNDLLVLNDNFDLMNKTMQLCRALDLVRDDYCNNSSCHGWVKIESDLALNGMLQAALSRDPEQNGGWLFTRCTDRPFAEEAIAFTIDHNKPECEKLRYKDDQPNDYARYAVMTGLKCLGIQPPAMRRTRCCFCDPAIKTLHLI